MKFSASLGVAAVVSAMCALATAGCGPSAPPRDAASEASPPPASSPGEPPTPAGPVGVEPPFNKALLPKGSGGFYCYMPPPLYLLCQRTEAECKEDQASLPPEFQGACDRFESVWGYTVEGSLYLYQTKDECEAPMPSEEKIKGGSECLEIH